MYRCRYMSMLHQLNDEQIAEGIRELEDGPLADVKSYDHISYTQVIHVTKFDLNWVWSRKVVPLCRSIPCVVSLPSYLLNSTNVQTWLLKKIVSHFNENLSSILIQRVWMCYHNRCFNIIDPVERVAVFTKFCHKIFIFRKWLHRRQSFFTVKPISSPRPWLLISNQQTKLELPRWNQRIEFCHNKFLSRQLLKTSSCQILIYS